MARSIAQTGKPTLLVGTKADNEDLIQAADALNRLGLGTPIITSAQHALGEIDLLEALIDQFEACGTPHSTVFHTTLPLLLRICSDQV